MTPDPLEFLSSFTATDLTYPSGRQITSGYDVLYRRNAINETSGGASIAAWQFFGGRTATVTLGNGITCSFMNSAQTNSAVQVGVPLPAWGDNTTDRLGYDGSGRLIAKRFLPPAGPLTPISFTTAYDPSSNKLFERPLHAGNRSALYPNYDSMDRLGEYQRGDLATGGGSITTPIMLPGTDSQRTYTLDSLGNWQNTVYTPEGGSPTTEIRQHNKLNEITQFASTPVKYDHGNNGTNPNPLIAQRGNGNIVNDGTRTYTFDALNRLLFVSRVSDGQLIASYLYDAIGRRILKGVYEGGLSGTIANAAYQYAYDGQRIIEEFSITTGSPTILRQFVWGQYIDELVQLTVPTTTTTPPLTAGTYYPLQDLLYRTTATTKSDGSIFEAYDYDAYGNTLMYSAAGSGGDWWAKDATTTLQPVCEFLFTGRQYDPETEIYWFRSRYYHQTLSRFFSRDRNGYNAGPNLYEYVTSQPVRFTDPFGLDLFSTTTVQCLYTGESDVVEEKMSSPDSSVLNPDKARHYVRWVCKCRKQCTKIWQCDRNAIANWWYGDNAVKRTEEHWDVWPEYASTPWWPTDEETQAFEKQASFVWSSGGSIVGGIQNIAADKSTTVLTADNDADIAALLKVKEAAFRKLCPRQCPKRGRSD